MKTISEAFETARLQSIPPHVIKTIILSEHKLDGTLLNEYDISTYLKGGLPLIDKDVEQELNKFIVGETTLKFHDPNKYLNDILEQSNRKFGLKILLNFDIGTVVNHMSTTVLTNAFTECVHGDYLYIGSGLNTVSAKYLINSDGSLDLVASPDFGVAAVFQIQVTDNYIYIGYDGGIKIFDHDFNVIGQTGGYENFGGLIISDDEQHAWGCCGYSSYNRLYYYDLSNKASPTQTIANSSRFFSQLVKSGDYLFVASESGTGGKLSVFDISTPASTPYAEIIAIDISETNKVLSMFVHEDSDTLYYGGIHYLGTIDISTPTNPSIISENNDSDIPFRVTNLKDRFIFGINGLTDKAIVGDTVDYRSIEAE
jgi:hypothetical protein